MASDLVIRTITIDDAGVSLEYVAPANDIKANGVQINHVVFVPRNDDYDDEITDLEERAAYLVRDVLEDLPALASVATVLARQQEENDNG